MSAATDLHNILSARFVRDVIGPAVKNGATYGDLMVLFESVQFGMMEILHRHYELTPQGASGLCEESLHRAIERFAGARKDKANG